MNSWKFNSMSQYYLRNIIIKSAGIKLENIYKDIESIKFDNIDRCIVKLKDGRQFMLIMEEI